MMKLLILSVFLLSATSALHSSQVDQPHNSRSSVIDMMIDLAVKTANAALDTFGKMLKNAEGTMKALVDYVEKAIESSLDQVSQDLEDLEEKIKNSECHPSTTVEELKQQVDSDILKCKENLTEVVENFEKVAQEFEDDLQQTIKEIVDLPNQCKSEKGFGRIIKCYAGLIADLNKKIGVILKNASDAFLQAGRLSIQAAKESITCTDNVTTSAKGAIDEILASCQFTTQPGVA